MTAKKPPEEHKPSGRPLKFKTPEKMQVEIDAYFNKCKADERPLTVIGLANALDIDRLTLINYAKRPAFVNTIKRAKARIEE